MSENSEGGEQPGKKVLIVDDNIDQGTILAKLLRLSGYEVEFATSVQHALGFVSQWTPDVVLLDIGLPHIDGYAAVPRFKERLPEARVYAVTGYGRHEDRERALAAGFDEHLVKPVAIDIIEGLLDQHGELPTQPGPHLQVLGRALRAAGSKERLCQVLAVSSEELESYISGTRALPFETYMVALDLVARAQRPA